MIIHSHQPSIMGILPYHIQHLSFRFILLGPLLSISKALSLVQVFIILICIVTRFSYLPHLPSLLIPCLTFQCILHTVARPIFLNCKSGRLTLLLKTPAHDRIHTQITFGNLNSLAWNSRLIIM